MKALALLALVSSVALWSSSQAALVAYWSFDSNFDASYGGTAFNLTPSGGATAGSAAGRFGNAASFSRASSQYAFTSGNVIGNNGITSAGRDFSYSAWFNYAGTDITDGSRYFILETTDSNSVGGNGYMASLGIRDNNGTAGNGTPNGPDDLEIYSYTAGVATTAPVGTTGAISGWQNVIVTFAANGANSGIFNIYLNGVSVFTSPGNYTQANSLIEGLVIGGHRSGTGRNFEGRIDEVAFYDNVLSASEIAYLQVNAVPEPSAALLGGFGVLALLRRRR